MLRRMQKMWINRNTNNFYSGNACMACRRIVGEDETLKPVTWDELKKLQTDCKRLHEIFADHIADVVAAERTDPIGWMRDVTHTVSADDNEFAIILILL